MQSLTRKLTWLALFSIAMGFMETAVVIYLRKIYYPGGFHFPLIPVSTDIAIVEFLREAATVIMLLSIGLLTGKTVSQKFAIFIYCFAIWDIFYYVFLKLFLNWPGSVFTWDILFLIPVPWVGPVLAPCVVSVSMILFALVIILSIEKNKTVKIKPVEWFLFTTGCLIIISSFISPYFAEINNKNHSAWILKSKRDLFEEIKQFVPTTYNWLLFCSGEFILLTSIFLFSKRIFSKHDTTIKTN
ncbi:MAG TPA: hypothetical protein VNZ49_08290 [Bacteroidia bacterium]|jgi:hypothetical protein|nr:hypothetical protein [Bacteroidia bacterium]